MSMGARMGARGAGLHRGNRISDSVVRGGGGRNAAPIAVTTARSYADNLPVSTPAVSTSTSSMCPHAPAQGAVHDKQPARGRANAGDISICARWAARSPKYIRDLSPDGESGGSLVAAHHDRGTAPATPAPGTLSLAPEPSRPRHEPVSPPEIPSPAHDRRTIAGRAAWQIAIAARSNVYHQLPPAAAELTPPHTRHPTEAEETRLRAPPLQHPQTMYARVPYVVARPSVTRSAPSPSGTLQNIRPSRFAEHQVMSRLLQALTYKSPVPLLPATTVPTAYRVTTVFHVPDGPSQQLLDNRARSDRTARLGSTRAIAGSPAYGHQFSKCKNPACIPAAFHWGKPIAPAHRASRARDRFAEIPTVAERGTPLLRTAVLQPYVETRPYSDSDTIAHDALACGPSPTSAPPLPRRAEPLRDSHTQHVSASTLTLKQATHPSTRHTDAPKPRGRQGTPDRRRTHLIDDVSVTGVGTVACPPARVPVQEPRDGARSRTMAFAQPPLMAYDSVRCIIHDVHVRPCAPQKDTTRALRTHAPKELPRNSQAIPSKPKTSAHYACWRAGAHRNSLRPRPRRAPHARLPLDQTNEKTNEPMSERAAAAASPSTSTLRPSTATVALSVQTADAGS
ncbi:hypothetical protein HETIRDRAFT_105836 [Heterobasidion irregulare TC 32-1]|uniref:Uncharacterized protein n=1 Tax=Heterobasidion irregulare (strain TC 32-1) TaxID=747525 RepID=W4JS14_HETIT|nr:uncharacterized protein HETIRDRAFT_105836 [Heterobasidion irregulare TC 32-1]ETW76342.1 hypothetical protein HETIRDRAFT_105836 [Heterobasidion irregulare TC 32-1]